MIAAPINVAWLLTNRCNYGCGFCWRVLDRRDLPLDAALAIVDKLAAAGARKISWAGGEPMLWPGIGELIRHTKAAGVETMLITNGSLLDRLDESSRAALDWLTLPLEGIGEEPNVRAGRDRGHYAQVVSTLRSFRDTPVRLKLNTVATRKNVDDVVAIAEHLAEWGIRRWKVFQFYPVRGIAARNADEFRLSDGSFEELRLAILDAVARHAPQCDVVVENTRELDNSYFTLAPNGEVYVSDSGADVYLGDLRTDSAEAIFARGELDKEKYTGRSTWLLGS